MGRDIEDRQFTGVQGTEITDFTLSELARDRPMLLVFYVYDFSPVCTDQMCEINDAEVLTFNDDAAVVGVSPDGPYSHQRFVEETGITYPLLTDDDKVLYEAFDMIEETPAGERQHKRGLVLLDSDLTVQHRWVAGDNWDEWSMERIEDANEVIRGLI